MTLVQQNQKGKQPFAKKLILYTVFVYIPRRADSLNDKAAPLFLLTRGVLWEYDYRFFFSFRNIYQ